MAAELARMVWQLDEPQADFSALNVLFISRWRGSNGIKVCCLAQAVTICSTGLSTASCPRSERVWDPMPEALHGFLGGVGRRLPGVRRFCDGCKVVGAAETEGDARLRRTLIGVPAMTVREPLRAGSSTDVAMKNRCWRISPSMAKRWPHRCAACCAGARYFLADHNLN